MATLNELGRNSASVTYGPFATGADIWPTFALVDQWLRNDTLQGYVTISNPGGTGTVTGVGTIFTTQLRAGDVISIYGQVRTVAAVASDTSFTVTATWTRTPSDFCAVKFIQYTLTGTADVTISGNTNGTVAVVNGSTTITGNGTFFLTEATNDAANTAGTVGRTICINGRLRVISAIASNTSMTVSVPMDFTDAGLRYKVKPRGTVAVAGGSASVTGTGTNFIADTPAGEEVFLGDELRIITPTTATAATLTPLPGQPAAALTQAVTGIPIHPKDLFLTGTGTAFLTELRVNDEIIINGSEYTITEIISNSDARVNRPITSNLSGAAIYKKRKLHGWVLEGTREGSGNTAQHANGKLGIESTITATAGSVHPYGTTAVTVASGTGFTINNIVKVQSGGGYPTRLTGNVLSATGVTQVNGSSTLFTTELHVGAEIVIAGQHLVVNSISNNTTMTVNLPITVTGPVSLYRSIPLFTFLAGVSGNNLTLGNPLLNTLYSVGSNPPKLFTPGNLTTATIAGADFIEYVYSAPNKSAEATTALLNTSNDRKYMGFRYFPLFNTGVITTANANYSLPVYERWLGSYGATNGVGINIADQSGGMVAQVSQSTTLLTVNTMTSGQIRIGTFMGSAIGNVTAFGTGTGNTGTYTVSGSQTLTTVTVNGSTGPGPASNANDIVSTTQTTGGFLYLFGNPRYFIVQGKSFANLPTQWIGCVEFERAQPEDASTGLGVTGINFSTTPANNNISGTSATSPWPTYAHINGNRFPVGAQLFPTFPVLQNSPVHGCVFSVPRARNSAGDLVDHNAHVYSACTITTGRWGHLYEMGAAGAYQPTNIPVGGILTTQPANTVTQPHLGQLVPVATNVYNSKRFMFSPVVVLGPTYDPDIRGRFYGLKIIPSALGTLMDTVSITSDSDFFYDSTQSALDHWVLTASIITTRFQYFGTTVTQSFRSLEDSTGPQAVNTTAAFTNNFRFAIPA
jgi:hypothetical protein